MLRRQGKSLRQIKEILGPMSNATLNDALNGEPPPEWTQRPKAKDELRVSARELRSQGMDYEEIAAASAWPRARFPSGSATCPRRRTQLRGMPEASRRRRRPLLGRRTPRPRGHADRGPRSRRRRDRRVDRSRDPHRRRHRLLVRGREEQATPPRARVMFMNSDPSLIRFFMRFLDATGRPVPSCLPRLYPRERRCGIGPAVLAGRYRGVRGQFPTPALKRHNPKTVRKNVGENYHGCLRIDVRRGADLYRRIEGWAAAGMGGRRAQNE